MSEQGSVGLLRRIFFKRFFDNDLISPSGDDHENVSLVFALLAVPGLLAAAPLLLKYMDPYILPGHRLLIALDDKFTCLALSMIVMGIVTLVEWDALVLDVRDIAILGPLPLMRRTLLLAKLGALAQFVVAFAAAVNAIPSVVYPLILFGTLQLSLARGLWVMFVHAAASLAAAAFAFFVVLSVRVVASGLAGPRLFRQVSVFLQGALVLALVSALLLLPGHRSVATSILPEGGAAVYASPPMWFLGLYESLTSEGVLDEPDVQSPRGRALWAPRDAGHAQADYLGLMPEFNRLAGVGVGAVALAALVAFGGYGLETRRLARRMSRGQASIWPKLLRIVSSALERTLVRDPLACATFFFTLQTLARSSTQRFYLAACGAVAFAATVVLISPGETARALTTSTNPTAALLAVQMVVVFCVCVGLRVVFAVPADLRANWTFRVTWMREPSRYFSGVRRAGLLVAMVPLFALAPLHVLAWGPAVAALHLVVGMLGAALLVEVAFFDLRSLPFTCAYGSTGTLKFTWPLYFGAFLLSTVGFGRLEAWAIETPSRAASLVAALLLALVVVALYRTRRTRALTEVAFDAPDDRATQRLGVSGAS